MRKVTHYCWISLLALQSLFVPIALQGVEGSPSVPSSPTPFAPFTGRITKNKVRMRLQPNFDSTIIRELNKDELLVIQGEAEEFYAVEPPPSTKAYIFRTFVLDNTVEGTRVNVRLEPNTDSPIIAQLNTGDHIQGTVSPLNSKWLEIDPPVSTRFYVAKEYLEKIGDPTVMATISRKRDEVIRLLNDTYTKATLELAKPFDRMQADDVLKGYKRILRDYPEFTEQANRAKELIVAFEDSYLRKKVAFLETKNKQITQETVAAAPAPAIAINAIPAPVEAVPQAAPSVQAKINIPSASIAALPQDPTSKMNYWTTAENTFYSSWSEHNENKSMNDFYAEQKNEAITLQGVLEPYHSSVKSKPGDFVLVNQSSHLPIAYLYSTQVNLDSYVGKEVSVIVSSRPNRHFAFPAYFVLGAQ